MTMATRFPEATCILVRVRRAATVLAAVLAMFFFTSPVALARSYEALHVFTGKNGAKPRNAVVRDLAGNLFGTASSGGDFSGCGGFGCGVVFKVDKNGNETLLHKFTGGADGADPLGDLDCDEKGNLYGTTSGGGDSNLGVVFVMDTMGRETVLHSFTGGTDGGGPWGGLVRDSVGNFYGTTIGGGDLKGCNGQGCGVIFMLDKSGSETVLYEFTGGADGVSPWGTLVRDKRGNLYGTTVAGGDLTLCFSQGCGVVFKLGASGKFTVLHTFEDQPDGANPNGGLVRDNAGTLYGTTSGGGLYTIGTVFKIHGHTETILHNFKGQPTDGRAPVGGLVRDKAGNLYGTTSLGGIVNGICTSSGCGTVFKIDKNGNETILHRFNIKSDPGKGGFPHAGLTIDKNGNLYGTTFYGGDLTCNKPLGCGVVFKLTP